MRKLILIGLMFGLGSGCRSLPNHIQLDAENPGITVTSLGVKVGETYVKPQEVGEILEDFDVPKTLTIHVRVEPDAMRDLTQARQVLGYLRVKGYTRNTLVTERMVTAESAPRKTAAVRNQSGGADQGRPKIRYKRANE